MCSRPGVTEASSDFCGYLDPPADPFARYRSPYDEDHRPHRAMYFGTGGPDLVVDSDEATTRTAERWLAEGAPRDRPWVLWVPLIFPHPPFTVEEPWFSMHDRRRHARPGPARGCPGQGRLHGCVPRRLRLGRPHGR